MQLLNISEAIFPNTFRNGTESICKTESSRKLRVHIGGESRIGKSLYVYLFQRFDLFNNDGVIKLLYDHTHFLELCRDAFHMLGYYVLYTDFSAGCGNSRHKCSCFYHIGNYCIRTTVERFHTGYFYNTRSRTRYLCTAGVEKVCKVNDVRLSRRVFDYGFSRCRDSRYHHVNRRTDRNDIKVNRISVKSVFGICIDISVFGVKRYLCSECFKALDVLVDGSYPKVTASGPADLCFLESGKLRSDKVGRAPHFADKLIRRYTALDIS